jgi:hypothetical protein
MSTKTSQPIPGSPAMDIANNYTTGMPGAGVASSTSPGQSAGTPNEFLPVTVVSTATDDDTTRIVNYLQRMAIRWGFPIRVDHRAAQIRLMRLWRNQRWSYGDLANRKTGETPERAQQKPTYMPNLLRQVITPLTYLYDQSPKRVPADLAGLAPEAQQEALKTHWMARALWNFGGDGKFNEAMGEIDRLVRLHGTVAVMLIWRPSPDTSAYYAELSRSGTVTYKKGDGGFDLLILHGGFFEVIPEPCDPTQPAAIIMFPAYDEYESALENFDPGSMLSPGLYWDKKCSCVTKGFTRSGEVYNHNFGFIPAVIVRNEPTTRDFWVWGLGGYHVTYDLWDMAQLWREYAFTAMCSRGQHWSDGEPEQGKGALGPDTLVIMKQGRTFGSVGLNADLAGMRQAVNDAQESWARSNNVPATLARLDETAGDSPLSGRAMLLQTAELEDDYPKRVMMMTRVERCLHHMAAKILASIEGTALNGELECIEFNKYEPKIQHAERMAELNFMASTLRMPDLYLLKELRPGVEDAILQAALDARPVAPSSLATPAAQVSGDSAKVSDDSSSPTRTDSSTNTNAGSRANAKPKLPPGERSNSDT